MNLGNPSFFSHIDGFYELSKRLGCAFLHRRKVLTCSVSSFNPVYGVGVGIMCYVDRTGVKYNSVQYHLRDAGNYCQNMQLAFSAPQCRMEEPRDGLSAICK